MEAPPNRVKQKKKQLKSVKNGLNNAPNLKGGMN